jgi:hypothetical protein
MFPLERFFRPPMARPLWVLLAIFALGLQSTALLIHFQLTPHVHPLALFASGTGGGAETGHHSRGEPRAHFVRSLVRRARLWSIHAGVGADRA